MDNNILKLQAVIVPLLFSTKGVIVPNMTDDFNKYKKDILENLNSLKKTDRIIRAIQDIERINND